MATNETTTNEPAEPSTSAPARKPKRARSSWMRTVLRLHS
jgi:hypothetical protein